MFNNLDAGCRGSCDWIGCGGDCSSVGWVNVELVGTIVVHMLVLDEGGTEGFSMMLKSE